MNNQAALGYMILTVKQAKLDEKVIKVLESIMIETMDFVSEEEAEQVYKSF